MAKITHEQEEQIVGALDYAQDKLSEAIEAVETLRDELRRDGLGDRANRMDAYIIPHLKSWLEDENQATSLADLRANLLDEND